MVALGSGAAYIQWLSFECIFQPLQGLKLLFLRSNCRVQALGPRLLSKTVRNQVAQILEVEFAVVFQVFPHGSDLGRREGCEHVGLEGLRVRHSV
jgi:hypothetical protein